jgi:hypothetical protein
MNEEYAHVLKTTHSPSQGFNRTDITVPYFQITDDFIGWGPHEGMGFPISRFIPTGLPHQYVIMSDHDIPYQHWFTFELSDSVTEISWLGNFYADSALKVQRFIRLQDSVEHIINQMIIAGTFEDSTHKVYKFTTDGRAVWPNKQFRYEVALDYTFGDPDYLINWSAKDSTGQVSYGFQFSGDDLFLYQQHGTEGTAMANNPTPFVRLKRVRTK